MNTKNFLAVVEKLVEINKEAKEHLSGEQMRAAKELAENEMLLMLMPLLKADRLTIAAKRNWIRREKTEIEKWEEYKKKKKVIERYQKACRYEYLQRESLATNQHFSDKKSQGAYRKKVKKELLKISLEGEKDVKADRKAGNNSAQVGHRRLKNNDGKRRSNGRSQKGDKGNKEMENLSGFGRTDKKIHRSAEKI